MQKIKCFSRFIGAILVVMFLLDPMPVSAWWSGDNSEMNPETDLGAVILSGDCGDKLTFELRDTGNLYISGKGEMYDYTSGTAPWCSYAAENKMRVAFDSGATYIGEYAFANCYSLKYVSFPDTLRFMMQMAIL